jgi:RiboL-PSP-HEPN
MTHLLPLTKALLRSRAHELTVYMRFLRIALEKDARVSTQADQLQLDKALTHMMKANVCLLLYSAMEACTVQLLDEMHDIIGENCKGTDQLNSQLVLKVARHFKASKTDITANNTSSPLHESLFKAWLVDWKDRNQREKREAGLSGSVDSRAIFNRLSQFGVFSTDVKDPPAHLTHSALRSVKERRNQLAHGELSFADLGQGLAFEELLRDALAVFRTLRSIVQEVNVFLQQQGYLATSALEPMEA